MSLSIFLAVVFAGVNVPDPATAQEFRLTGQLRPRYEERDPDVPAPPLGDVTMRARLGAIATLPESVVLRVDFQDVVVWGGSSATPGGAPAPDVFQAYVEVMSLFGSESAVRVGRQELAFGNQRLVSNNNWGQRGGRFDGVRVMWRGGGLPVDLFAMRVAESGASAGPDAWFNGAYAEVPIRADEVLSLYAIYNRERGPFETDQFTVGGHTTITLAGIGWMGEGYLQLGERRGESVSAYELSVGAVRTFGRLTSQLLYEYLSGDTESDEDLGAFDRLRGSNHGYHGYADLFTSVAANTDEHGLGDLSLRNTIAAGTQTDVQVNGHLEVDLILTHRPRGGLALEVGAARVLAGPALEEVQGLDRDLTWAYGMVTVSF
jgi:hypothetical protein